MCPAMVTNPWPTSAVANFSVAPFVYIALIGPNAFVLQEDGLGNLELLDNNIVVALAPVAQVPLVIVTGAPNTTNTSNTPTAPACTWSLPRPAAGTGA